MQTAGKCAQCLDIGNAGEFHVEGAELVPLGLACDPDEGGEVEGGVVAHVLVVCLHRRVHEEVSDALVNRRAVFQRGNEWPYVLESSATHDLRRWVQQEPVVELLQTDCVFVHGSDFGDLRDDIRTGLPHFPLLVLGEAVVQWEELLAEHVSRDVLRHVGQVLCECAPHTRLLVETESAELVHYVALVNLLAHVA